MTHLAASPHPRSRSIPGRRASRFLLLVAGLALCLAPVSRAQDSGTEEGGDRLKPLPPEKLPPATRPRPDPEKEQFRLFPVHVVFEEVVIPRSGEPYLPEETVIQPYLARYLARAGHPVVDSPAKARRVIVGNFEGSFLKELRFKNVLVAVKVVGTLSVEVLDEKGKSIDSFSLEGIEAEGTIPRVANSKLKGLDPERKGLPLVEAPSEAELDQPEEYNAILDLRRRAAKVIWRRLYHHAGPFSDGVISGKLDALTNDPLEEDEFVSGDLLLDQVVQARFRSVPCLLEALTDTRPVLAPFTYPGLTPLNADRLRVYHFADKALEEIFQKVSRMSLETPDRHRFVIIQGWQNEWKRFCPSWRQAIADDPSAAER